VFFRELNKFLVCYTGAGYDHAVWPVPLRHEVTHERSVYDVNAILGAEKRVSEALAVICDMV